MEVVTEKHRIYVADGQGQLDIAGTFRIRVLMDVLYKLELKPFRFTR